MDFADLLHCDIGVSICSISGYQFVAGCILEWERWFTSLVQASILSEYLCYTISNYVDSRSNTH